MSVSTILAATVGRWPLLLKSANAIISLVTYFGWGPKLRLTLRNKEGVLASEDPNKPRYYHLVVTNERMRTPAKSVEVRLEAN